jgi:serine/threonine-protein kinase
MSGMGGPFARSGALAGYSSSRPPIARSMEATAMVRPASARTGRFVMIGLIAAAAVVAAVMLYPQRGRIVINISDAKGASVNRADIFVDGHKQCDTAPCIVEDMNAGSHEVKVLAEGSDTPQIVSVNVEARKDANATFTVGSKTGLKVSGTQPGVKLYVDDKELGPLPQEVHDLAAGDHVIKLAGSERYQPLEKHVTVEKDKVEDLGAVTLKVLKGKATISLATPGARVFLASGADRRELPMLPISVDIDTTKAWSLQASKPGFADYSQPISFDDGQAEKSFSVTLDARAVAIAAPQPYVPPPAPAPAPRPAPPPQPPPQVAQNENAGGGDGEAFLNINSIPPSTCILDGKSLGTTPKVHIQVRPGSHTVKFINADEGLTKTISVSVGAGETKPAVAKLN